MSSKSQNISKRPRLVLMCAGCGRVKFPGEKWKRVKPVPVSSARIDVSHGICPVCFASHYPEL